MTFDSWQPVVLMLLYLSDGLSNESVVAAATAAAVESTSPTPGSMTVSNAWSTVQAAAVSKSTMSTNTFSTVQPTRTPSNIPNTTTAALKSASLTDTPLLLLGTTTIVGPTKPPTRPTLAQVGAQTATVPVSVGHRTASTIRNFHSPDLHYMPAAQQHKQQPPQQHHQWPVQRREPLFGSSSSSASPAETVTTSPDSGMANVTAQIGANAYLPCQVNKIQNKSVSWVRLRDEHILTVDRMVFIADERFNAFHPMASEADQPDQSWKLQIKFVQARDEGVYECQVSSEPKISARIFLHVVVPRTELIGDPSRFVKEGSKVSLHCIVTGAIDPPLYIIWYHGEQQIFPDNRRGWRTDINRESVQANPAHGTIGTLIIPAVKKRDSGNYTCKPSNSRPISTMLTVINGEYSASAITSAASPIHNRNWQLIVVASILCALLMAHGPAATASTTATATMAASTMRTLSSSSSSTSLSST